MSTSLVIPPTKAGDIKRHSDEQRADCVRLITDRELTPGKFSMLKASGDAATAACAFVLTAATFGTALIVTVIFGLLMFINPSPLWFWGYALCLPTGILAVPFLLSTAVMIHKSKRAWVSRRRYAYSQGWLTEYEFEIELHKRGVDF